MSIPEGGTGATTDTGARAAIKTNVQTYTRVSQLGLTSGVPTINEVFAAMPAGSSGHFESAELLSSEAMSSLGRYNIYKDVNVNRSSVFFVSKLASGGIGFRGMNASTAIFDPPWYKLYTAANASEIAPAIGLSQVSTTTPVTPSTIGGGGKLTSMSLYKIGKMVVGHFLYEGMSLAANSATTDAAIIPTEYRPPSGVSISAACRGTGNSNVMKASISGGTLTLYTEVAATWAIVDATWITDYATED